MNEVLPPLTQTAYKKRPGTPWLFWLGILALLSFIMVSGIIIYIQQSGRKGIVAVDQVPTSTIALVLGASLQPNGNPSDALLDRILTGVELYQAKKVQKILMTGDGGLMRSNEVAVMKQVALDKGVPESDLLIDGEGYRTYESCKRANEVFHITSSTIIVTQDFHLPRALYLCNHLGVESVGIIADKQPYRNITRFIVRDWLASFKAWVDLYIWSPKPPV